MSLLIQVLSKEHGKAMSNRTGKEYNLTRIQYKDLITLRLRPQTKNAPVKSHDHAVAEAMACGGVYVVAVEHDGKQTLWKRALEVVSPALESDSQEARSLIHHAQQQVKGGVL